jgi:anthranilate synthase component 1
LNDFLVLAHSYPRIPLIKTISSDLLTPVAAFLRVAAKETKAFLFESVHGGENVGRYTFIGMRPYQTLVARTGMVEISGKKKQARTTALIPELKQMFVPDEPLPLTGLPPFTAGAVGFVAYDAVRALEPIPAKAKDDLHVPDAFLMFVDRLLAFDHVRQQLHVIANVDVTNQSPKKAYQRAQLEIAAIEKKLRAPLPRSRGKARAVGKLAVKQSVTREQFLEQVARGKEHIAAGDIFQLVLSLRLQFKTNIDPFAIYRALRQVNPSPYMFFVRMGDMHVVGSSPEMLVRVTGDRIEYRPIAGTRPRGRTPAEDEALEAELRADEKECAEHIMLVDLGRNDVGRVSRTGSVKVKQLQTIERYSHVMHMVSAIEGRLERGLSAWDAFASCVPAGTLTGAPKVRAMQLIEELEPVRRGVYGGSVLYADRSGNLDSCIAIRTLVMQGKHAYVQAGAGIVADSVPEAEYQECLNKAQALLRAVELAGNPDFQ